MPALVAELDLAVLDARDEPAPLELPEIAAFRIRRGAVNQSRVLENQRVTTFGRDFGITNTEFHAEGSGNIGRQSQTWIRTDSGWKIVSAHVSFGL